MSLLESGDYAAATVPLGKARRAVEPEKSSVREALGRALFRAHRYDEAADEFEAVIERYPVNDYAHFCLGRSLSLSGHAERARRHLAIAANLRPDRRDYRVYRERAAGACSAPPTPTARPLRALVQRVSPPPSLSRASGSRDRAGPARPAGVRAGDSEAEADRIADKLRALRVFEDADGKMNEPLGDREILCVSQFTLYGDTRKGNRPSFVERGPARAGRAALRAGLRRLGAKRGHFRRDDGRRARQRRSADPADRGLTRARQRRLKVAAGRVYTQPLHLCSRSVARGGPPARLFYRLRPDAGRGIRLEAPHQKSKTRSQRSTARVELIAVERFGRRDPAHLHRPSRRRGPRLCERVTHALRDLLETGRSRSHPRGSTVR